MNENENTEQVQETETIKQLQTELTMERHHVMPEHRELISATLAKLADESTSEEKAFELMQKMYPEAFQPKVPEFSVSTTGVSGIMDKSGFLAGFTGNKPL